MVFGAGFYLIRTTVEPGFREVYDYGHYGLSENKVPVFLGIPGNSWEFLRKFLGKLQEPHCDLGYKGE
jgi:hypothetical protein